jgi:hypothetical protein
MPTQILTPSLRRFSDEIGSGPSVARDIDLIQFDDLKQIGGAWYEYRAEELQLGVELMPVEVDSRLQAGQTVVRRLKRVPQHVEESAKGRVRRSPAPRSCSTALFASPAAPPRSDWHARRLLGRSDPPKPFAPVLLDPPSLAAQPEKVRSLGGAVPVAPLTGG